MFRTAMGCVVALCVSSFAAGCGGSSPRAATFSVSGQVTYQGSPVKSGLVNFTDKGTGNAASAALDADGKFQIAEMSGGTYQVFITPPAPTPGPNGEPAEAVADPADIPKKYRDPATSGLKAEVKSGEENRFEFALTP